MESVRGLYKSFTGGRILSIGGRQIMEEKQISEEEEGRLFYPSGGFGFVSLARDVSSGQQFALKKICCQTREVFDLACREALILEQLPPHPNIVEFHGWSTESVENRSKLVYILMEFCNNGHLLDVLNNNRSLGEVSIVKIFTDVTMSIFHLHSQQPPVIHRDIKLENILRSSSGVFKLCDFGSASSDIFDVRSVSREKIAELEDMIAKHTTLIYRPPEMIDLFKKLTVGEKGDIWMLGCILYSLVFNHHPFQDASVLAISNAIFDVDLKIANRMPKLMDLIFWTLFPDPSSRPSAEDLLEVLQRYDKLDFIPLPLEVASWRIEVMDKATQDQLIRSSELKDMSRKTMLEDRKKEKNNKGKKSGSNQKRLQTPDPSLLQFSKTPSEQFRGLPTPDPLMQFQTDPFKSPSKDQQNQSKVENWTPFPQKSDDEELNFFNFEVYPTPAPPPSVVDEFSAPFERFSANNSTNWINGFPHDHTPAPLIAETTETHTTSSLFDWTI